MIRLLCVLLLACAAAVAQVQILLVDTPTSERPVSGVHSLGSTAVGDRIDTVFRIRNTSTAALTIRSLAVGGSGFTMSGQPSLPHSIAPGLNMDFTIRFAPRDFGSYSANLTVNGTSLLLTGSSTAAPVLSTGGAALPVGSSVDLGLLERGTTTTKSFHLENTTSETVTVQRIDITGKHFGMKGVVLPLELAPRTAIDFDVLFAPTTSGVFAGSLAVDGRAIKLTAAANEPPFPKPAIVIDLPNPTSGQQGRVSVHFGQASRAIGSGKISMQFQSAAAMSTDDEAVRFTRGNRSANFDVTEGASIPVSEMTFQTGTTAGTIVFVAEVGGWTVNASVEIAPQRVHFDKVRAVRNGTMLEVEITGYDNTRSASQLGFTFFTANGEVVKPGQIRVDTAADFRRYFQGSTLGGSYVLKAVFPVAGAATNIASVEVDMTNSSGSAPSGKVQFQ